jgi:hypothetical protein
MKSSQPKGWGFLRKEKSSLERAMRRKLCILKDAAKEIPEEFPR